MEWNRRGKLEQQRNWIDFYDCLMLQWFFYLRALDMPRLQSDWLKDMGDDTVVLYIYEPNKTEQSTKHTIIVLMRISSGGECQRGDQRDTWHSRMYSRRVGDENAAM